MAITMKILLVGQSAENLAALRETLASDELEVVATAHLGPAALTWARTDVRLLSGVSAAPVAAKLMGEVLGWDAEHEQLEVDTYLERVRAERESQTMPDDSRGRP